MASGISTDDLLYGDKKPADEWVDLPREDLVTLVNAVLEVLEGFRPEWHEGDHGNRYIGGYRLSDLRRWHQTVQKVIDEANLEVG